MVKRGIRKNQLYLFAILIILILIFSFILYKNRNVTGKTTSPEDNPTFPYYDPSYGSCNGLCQGTNNEICFCDEACLAIGDCCHDYKIELCVDDPCKKPGEIYCRDTPLKPGVCCDEPTSKCGTIGGLGLSPAYGDETANVCIPKDKASVENFCEKNFPQQPQECPPAGGFWAPQPGLTLCCKDSDTCDYILIDKKKVPICNPVDPKTCKPGDKGFCSETANGGTCCGQKEECVGGEFGGQVNYCIPSSCKVSIISPELSEVLCKGSGDYGKGGPFETAVCCDSGSKCTHQPNGAPKCEKVDKVMAQCGNGITETGEVCDVPNAQCSADSGQKCKTDCTGYETCSVDSPPITDCSNKCGDYDPNAACQCDPLCVAAGDCCPEYEVVCGMATG